MSSPRKIIPIKLSYNCEKCPGWCCAYEHVPVTARDLTRIAKHFDISEDVAAKRYTKIIDGELGMRHRKDHVYKSICAFFDQEARRCGAYGARPTICRTYPSGSSCGYYDFLVFERDQQGDESFVPH